MLFKEASRWLTPVLTVSMLRLVATEAAQPDSRNWPNKLPRSDWSGLARAPEKRLIAEMSSDEQSPSLTLQRLIRKATGGVYQSLASFEANQTNIALEVRINDTSQL